MSAYSCYAILAALSLGAAWGQVSTGTIVGVVEDASGAMVPKASVTVTQTATGETRGGTTSTSGEFNFPFLRTGPYTVNAVARGPVSKNADVSVFKNTHFTERHWLQFCAEFFNFNNTPTFFLPCASSPTLTCIGPPGGACNALNPNFGKLTSGRATGPADSIRPEILLFITGPKDLPIGKHLEGLC